MTVAEKLIRAKSDIDAVYEAGKALGVLDFDRIQVNGTRTDYRYLFAGGFWKDDNFKPTHDIKAYYAEKIFAYSKITNLKKILEDCGVTLDVSVASKNGNVVQLFQGSDITDVGVLDVSRGGLAHMLNGAQKLKNVDKIILKDDGSQAFTGVFDNCKALEEIRFDGVIGQTLSISWSTNLSADSLEDIVMHLSDTATGKTVTFPTTAQSNYDAVKGEGAWSALVATKTNWTIAYA